MIDKLNMHYSFTNPASVYDEEALTALELAARTAKKVNEVVESQNNLETRVTDEHRAHTGEVEHRLELQDERIEKKLNVDMPLEVDRNINAKINDGTFDAMIDEYAGDLSARLDNIVSNAGNGNTEIVDIRVDYEGLAHATAGAAVRAQVSSIRKHIENTRATNGIYQIPLEWSFNTSSSVGSFNSNPFRIPESGFTITCDDHAVTIGDINCYMTPAVELGYIVNGSFEYSQEMTSKYGKLGSTRRAYYIPHVEGLYARVKWGAVGSGDQRLTPNNYTDYYYTLPMVKVWAGTLEKTGGLVGTHHGNINIASDNSDYTLTNGIIGKSYKYQMVMSPVPLGAANYISCSPHYWMGMKVYKYNTVTGEHEFFENIGFKTMNPCWGNLCYIDCRHYDDSYFGILQIGRTPLMSDYQAVETITGAMEGTRDTQVVGLDRREIERNVYVDWAVKPVNTSGNGCPIVLRNIEFIKSLSHRTATGHIPRATSNYHYLLEMDNFAGILYGGSCQSGTFFYNVSPATYYTALLNPNSNAYGYNESPAYGVVCSTFAPMLYGFDIPRSTFDFRYNPKPMDYSTKSFNADTEYNALNTHDILNQGQGHTGHTMVVTNTQRVNDVQMLTCIESVTPATGENTFMLHDGAPFVRKKGYSGFRDAFDFITKPEPERIKSISALAEWIPAYTEPQKVMCNRGYGSVYTTTINVKLSVSPDVEQIEIYINDELAHTRLVADLLPELLHGYNVVDITTLVTAGKIRVRNNVDDSFEEFYVIDPAPYMFNAELNEDTLKLTCPRYQDVKYIDIVVCPVEGEDKTGANLNYYPEFNERGEMVINTLIDAGHLGMWSLAARPNWQDSVNVIYKTEHDTNTFCVDAEGDAIA